MADTNIHLEEDLLKKLQNDYANYKKSPKSRITSVYIETRLELLENLWSKLETNHYAILGQSSKKTVQGYNCSIFDEAEEVYICYKVQLKEDLIKLQPSSSNTTNQASASLNQNTATTESAVAKLPKIQLPKFSGIYTEWPTFRDLFESLVNQTTLPKVQKLNFLKAQLTGEAEQLVRHIAITNDNYDQCWDDLKRRYNNKRYIINNILTRFMDQKALQAESSGGVKQLLDTSRECLESIRNLGIDISTWDVLIVFIVSQKLDVDSRKQWEQKACDQTDTIPTWNELFSFLESRFRSLEFIKDSKTAKIIEGKEKPKSFNVTTVNCQFCNEDHLLYNCKKFANEDYSTRHEFVQKSRLCYNCFGKHSVTNCQRHTSCRRCGRRHHSLLHPVYENKVEESDNDNSPVCSSNEIVVANHFTSDKDSMLPPGLIILATALVKINNNGNVHVLRALLDQGSQATFITERAVQKLGLCKTSVCGAVSGLGGGNQLSVKSFVKFSIQSTHSSFSCGVKAFVLSRLSSNIPSQKFSIQDWPQLSSIILADPQYNIPSQIDILLGADVYSQILFGDVIKSPSKLLSAQNTELGWILSGRAEVSTQCFNNIISFHIYDDSLSHLLRSFWELETDQPTKILTEEENQVERFYNSTTTRDEDGRYVVALPFRDEIPKCKYGDSRTIALHRFHLLENRFKRDANLKLEYSKAVNDFIDSNHMEEIRDFSQLSKTNCVYLPHHAVVRADKTTTKYRIVFDASCKTRNGHSLNDDLLVGPRLQSDLRHILLRWRTYPICLVADIIKMYRQVKLRTEDTDYHRLFWRNNADEEIKEYRMLRVTFGVSSSPYLAVKSLQQVAHDEGDSFDLAACRVVRDFYMDDFMSGCQTEDEAVTLYLQMTELLGKGKFQLQKWASNSKKLMRIILGEETVKNYSNLEIKIDDTIKILGLCWDSDKDNFIFKVKLPEIQSCVTKRVVLSDISRLFDPLGWIAPVVIKAKIFMQKLWLSGLSWDVELSSNLLIDWLNYREQLQLLSNFEVPRWIYTNDINKLEIHGFCDASNDAYAAVVYARVTDADGIIHVNLITARTKVSPLKQISIPRLELCGAELLANLLQEISLVMAIPCSNMCAWTDSSIVLGWLQSEPSRWKTFVANRVSKIQAILDNDQWSHIESVNNPADCASRGLNPNEFIEFTMWIKGPQFLQDSSYCKVDRTSYDHDLEQKSLKSYFASSESSQSDDPLQLWTKFSSLNKLVHVVAWCKRFINTICKRDRGTMPRYLTAFEIKHANDLCLRYVQSQLFSNELNNLNRNKSVSKASRLYTLCPYIDPEGLMRVKGRIQNSHESFDTKHPIILSAKHHIVKLIIRDAHAQTLHGANQLMLNYLRSKYWILNVKDSIRQCIRSCCKCVKYKATTQTPLMGQLPEARVTLGRAFSRCCVDYAGPINVRISKGRGCKSYKGYICIFVCTATRAIHLEAVSDLTSEGFISCFKRFQARRGPCREIFSDNGTNFVGASKELKDMFTRENSKLLEEVASSLSSLGIIWHFLPPHSPNFGGLHEAGVRSTKFHLRRIIDGTTLTYEELSTVLAQIEACLNSRPMYRVTDQGNDIPLTPGHFLIGEPLVTVPDYNYENTTVSSLRRWQYTQKLLQDFWRKWSQEYLTTLCQRYKWAKITPEPNVGDVVLVKENDLPPSKWLFGRIVSKHPGQDNITRVVSLKCKDSVIKRPVSKLCILPVKD